MNLTEREKKLAEADPRFLELFEKREAKRAGKPLQVAPKTGKPLQVAPKKSRGLGDTIAKATSALGIRPCGGCKERQAKLNALVPYKPTPEQP